MEEKIITVIRDLCPIEDDIEPDRNLKEDLGIDSLRLVELLVALEEEFAIEFELTDLNAENFNIVSDLYDLVSRYTGG